MGSPIQDLGPIRADVNVCVVATDVVIDIDVHVGAVLIDVHVSAVVVYVYVDIYVGEKFPGGTREKNREILLMLISLLLLLLLILMVLLTGCFVVGAVVVQVDVGVENGSQGRLESAGRDKRKIAQQEKRDGSDEILGKP